MFKVAANQYQILEEVVDLKGNNIKLLDENLNNSSIKGENGVIIDATNSFDMVGNSFMESDLGNINVSAKSKSITKIDNPQVTCQYTI